MHKFVCRAVGPLLLSFIAIGTSFAADVTPPAQVRLYALDCGRIEFKDMAMFSDTGEYDGVSGTLADPCFVIRHPKGTLLWDAGLGDELAGHPGNFGPGIQLFVDVPLQAQLHTLGIEPNDITYLAMSHFHLDHVGNARLFAGSTWLVNKAELAAMSKPEPPSGVDPKRLEAYKQARLELIEGDHDVFSDGSVRILRAAGHTPGHQVLLLRLPRAGYVLLSGDLYHSRDNRQHRRVPINNTDRADTLTSMDRIERIVGNLHARVIVQHDPKDFREVPKFPAYLE